MHLQRDYSVRFLVAEIKILIRIYEVCFEKKFPKERKLAPGPLVEACQGHKAFVGLFL